jgi:UDP-N-acetyl-D-glucosamine dehydrogenase
MRMKTTHPGRPGPALERLLTVIEDRTARIAIIGQGYVGLPLAMVIAEAGFDVQGYDIDSRKVELLNAGTSYIGDIPSERLQAQMAEGRFRARETFEDLGSRDVISICVPTPLSKTRDPDISYIVAAAEQVVEGLRPGQLIVLESTTYPGTTEELVLPIFERSGLKVGRDYFLCFSPERVDPGNPQFDIHNTPRLMGGITGTCTRAGAAMYGSFLQTIISMSSTQAAEMAKLLENTFRAVNIGLVNEVALMCRKLGLDTWEIIDAAATKPFGFMRFYPGPGLGGHCIPVDPHYLAWILKTLNYNARFIELASEINTSMPAHVVMLVADVLNDERKPVNGSRILVLGVAYKADVDDVRESPALDVIQLLQERGAAVQFHDPYVESVRLHGGERMVSTDLDDEVLRAADCVVITTDHKCLDWERVASLASTIVDSRNATGKIVNPAARIVKI